MSRFSRIFLGAAAILGLAACARTAKVSGVIEGAPASDVVVKVLNVNQYQVLDTLKTDASGKFSCKVDVAKGQPEFVYVFHKDRKIASLLLEAGDKVSVKADTLGASVVEGSEESLKLAAVEADFAAAKASLAGLSEKLQSASSSQAEELRKQIGKTYVDYYRSRVAYVMNNSRSLTIVPVMYQSFSESLPVFGQATDALHFSSAADTLEMVYPDSKYVKALRKEADQRLSYLNVAARLSTATEIGYPEVVLPDVQGNKLKLSEVEAKSKVTMLFFWTPSNTSQKMFNLDVLKSVYADYHKRGFEIYQVAIDPDKALWAKVVKEQALPWVNVCDGRGAQSPYVLQYNLSALPLAYIISDGTLVDGQVVDEKSLRKFLNNLLK